MEGAKTKYGAGKATVSLLLSRGWMRGAQGQTDGSGRWLRVGVQAGSCRAVAGPLAWVSMGITQCLWCLLCYAAACSCRGAAPPARAFGRSRTSTSCGLPALPSPASLHLQFPVLSYRAVNFMLLKPSAVFSSLLLEPWCCNADTRF